MNMKKVPTSGKNFLAFALPETLSTRLSKLSTAHSTKFCAPLGTMSCRRVPAKKKITKAAIPIQVPINVLVTGIGPILKSTSGGIIIG
jgi:hypothetical protein